MISHPGYERLADLEVVLRLASDIEDRTDAEQRSLLRVARWVDVCINANVIGNHRMWGDHAGSIGAKRQRAESVMERLVDATRVLDPTRDKRVQLPVRRRRAS